MLALGKQISSGAQGAAVFNNALTSGANLASEALKGFGPWGQALGLATKGLMAFVSAVANRSDALYKGYQEISRSGAIATGGMDEVGENLKKFSYGLNEMGNMGALLAENGKNLALFGGSVIRGTKQISGLAEGVKNSDLQRQFMNLGLTVDAQNHMIAGYVIQQGRLGRATDVTTKGMAAYVREQEILTRLTGQSAREMQEQFEAQLQMDDFMAGIMDMPKEAREEARKAINMFNGIDPSGKLARGFAASINGLGHTTEEGAQMFAASNGKIQEDALALARGNLKAVDLVQQYGDAVGRNLETQKQLSKVGANYMTNLATSVRVVQFTSKGVGKVFDETGEIVDKSAAGFNANTNAATKLRISQIKSRESMEDFLQLGVGPVTKAMEILAKVVERLYSLLPGGKSIAAEQKDIDKRKQQLDTVADTQTKLEQAKQEGKPAEVVAAIEADLKEAKNTVNAAGAEMARATVALAEQQAKKVKESEQELAQIKRSKEQADKDAEARAKLAKTAEEKAKAEQESAKIAKDILEQEKKAKADLETAAAEKKELFKQARQDMVAQQRKQSFFFYKPPGQAAGSGAPAASTATAPATTAPAPAASTATAPATTAPAPAPAASTATAPATTAPAPAASTATAPAESAGPAVGSKVSEKPIAAVLSAGSGFTTVSTTDNDKQQRKGVRNWRNNNPGNIEFGPFAKSLGAVGTDGRFAVFPDMQAGMKAKEKLLFGSKSYINLSIADAIHRYAPPSENDTAAYIKAVTAAASVTSDTTLNSLNASQRSAFLAAISKQEGLRTGEVLQAEKGNVFTGPRNGYRAMLHGTEAVVPLPDGRTIPVTIAGLAEQNDRLAQVLSAIETRMGSTGSAGSPVSDTLLSKLDDFIRVSSDQLGVLGKILKAQA
jgi:hypothetical protein